MKTVVIVAPSFSPSSYPPAIRTRFFASHLPKFGWNPIVLTVRPKYLEEIIDPDFEALLPKDLEIIRTTAVPQSLTRLLRFGDLGLRSFPFHLAGLLKLRKRKIDALLIPGPPWYPFCLGPIMKHYFKIPYILDYIDPWVNSGGYEAKPFTKAWGAHRAALLLEKPAVQKSSAIIAVSQKTNELVQKHYPKIPDNHFHEIPYGFEPSDFEVIRQQNRPSPHLLPFKNHINICYVGAMLPKAYGTLRAFFRAIQKLRQTHERSDLIRIHFYGTTYATGSMAKPLVLPVANEEGVGDITTEHPERIPYLEALRILSSANLLLAMGSSETHYTASKIFPYLLARRPLLAVYHEASSVCEIMRTAKSGKLVTYNNQRPVENCVDEIAKGLGEFLDGDTFQPNSYGIDEVSKNFSACEMTSRLARVLNSVTP